MPVLWAALAGAAAVLCGAPSGAWAVTLPLLDTDCDTGTAAWVPIGDSDPWECRSISFGRPPNGPVMHPPDVDISTVAQEVALDPALVGQSLYSGLSVVTFEFQAYIYELLELDVDALANTTVVQSASQDWNVRDGSFEVRRVSLDLAGIWPPPSAIRITLRADRQAGSDNDIYLDQMQLITTGVNLLIDPGCEEGGFGPDEAWVSSAFSWECDDRDLNPRTGTSYFIGPSNEDVVTLHQDVDIAGLSVDTGRFEAWITTRGDSGRSRMLFLSADGTVLAELVSPLQDNGSTSSDWTEVVLASSIPLGTTVIRAQIEAFLDAGSIPNAYFDDLSLSVSLDEGPLVTSVDPTTVRGGIETLVTIQGRGFGVLTEDLAVTIGEEVCFVEEGGIGRTPEGTEQLVCRLDGPVAPAGLYALIVFRGGLESTERPHLGVTIEGEPQIYSVTPSGGLAGTTVLIEGEQMGSNEDRLTVLFGGQQATIVPGSLDNLGRSVRVIAPNNPVGTAEVQVSVLTVSSPTTVPFEYFARPTITGISPGAGRVGITLTVTGTSFGSDQDAIEIDLDDEPCIAVVLIDDTEARCTVPPGPEGAVVVVSLRRFGVQTLEDNFLFTFSNLLNPAVFDATPEGVQDGSEVRIRGGGFGTEPSDLIVDFGRHPCIVIPSSLNSAGNELTCVLSMADPVVGETLNIVVARSGVENDPPFVSVTVIESPVVERVFPAGGLAGSPIVLSGTDFGDSPDDISVTVGGATCPLLHDLPLNGTQVRCSVPALLPGPHEVRVTRYDTPSAPPHRFFMFIERPVLVSLTTAGGVAGATLRLVGTGFGSDPDAIAISVGGFDCPVEFGSLAGDGTTVRCVAPAGPPIGEAAVVLRVFDVASPRELAFEYVGTPVITRVDPAGGIPGTEVLVEGTGFGNQESDIDVFIGSTTRQCGIVSGSLNAIGTRLRCVVPEVISSGAAPVIVDRFDVSSVVDASSPTFTYVTRPQISTTLPRGGTAGTILTVTGINMGSTESQLAVTVGTQTCAIVPGSLEVVQDETSVQCVVPDTDGLVGQRVVSVSRFSVDSEQTSVSGSTPLFEYIVAPILDQIVPGGGRNGSVIQLLGSGFGGSEEDLEIVIGDAQCVGIVGSLNAAGTRMDCAIVGLTEVGPMEASLSRLGLLAELTAPFESILQPVQILMHPRGGPIGTRVTIFGSNFGTDESQLSVPTTDCPIQAGTASESCELPGGSGTAACVQCEIRVQAIGEHDLVLSRFSVLADVQPLDDAPVGLNVFETVAAPELLAVDPQGGTVGDRIVLTGNGFGLSPADMTVVVGGLPCLVDEDNADERTLPCVISDEGVGSWSAGPTTVRVEYLGVPSNELEFLLVTQVQFLDASDPLAAFILAMLVIVMLLALVTLVLVYKNRKTPLIRAASPVFCYLILVGVLVGCTALSVFIGRPNNMACLARVWLSVTAFNLVFGCLVAKTWRVAKIFGNAALKTIAISDMQLLQGVALLFVVDYVLLTVWSPTSYATNVLVGGNVVRDCRSNSDFPVLLFVVVIKFLTIAFGVVLSIKTRKVSAQFNESKHIAFSIYNMLLWAMLGFPILLTQRDDGQLTLVVRSLGGITVMCTTMGVLFWRRIYFIYFRPEKNKHWNEMSNTMSTTQTSMSNTTAATPRDSRLTE